MSLIKREDTILVGIDFQEKLMPAMSSSEALEDKTVRLVKGMKAMGVPMVFTQQYTKGLGATTETISEAAGNLQHVEKHTFSCMRNEEFAEKIKVSGKKNVVVCGIEAHICVLQTVIQLLDDGYNVHLVADCVSSRDENDKLWGITRMGEAGAVITTYESVLYELLADSKAAEFKEISAIVK